MFNWIYNINSRCDKLSLMTLCGTSCMLDRSCFMHIFIYIHILSGGHRMYFKCGHKCNRKRGKKVKTNIAPTKI